MLKTILVLPDGTQITSGAGTQNAIKSITVTQCVSDDQQMTVGAVCAAMAEIDLITPGGGLKLTAGDELTIYREDETGQRHKLGLFTAQKPTRPSPNTLRLTAFDRVTWLDRDMTRWLESLSGWPYDLETFSRMVCAECGVSLGGDSFPNGNFLVQKFSPGQVTGRQLIRWAAQIAGRFCRANAEGELEFAWYSPRQDVSIGPRFISGSPITLEQTEENLSITGENVYASAGEEDLQITASRMTAIPDGRDLIITVNPYNVQYFYYQNSLSFEDYTVAPVEKVQLQQSQQDVGTVYPDTQEAVNTYILTGNYLLAAGERAQRLAVAASLYELLHPITYTPCRVSLPANWNILPGDIVPILDPNGKCFSMYVMKKVQRGQRDILECTGSPRRDSTEVVNNGSFGSLAGKILTLEMDVDGLKLENAQGEKQAASLALTVDGIVTEVRRQQNQLDGMNTSLTQIRQDADGVALEIRNLRQEGVSRVETTTGYTFCEDGLRIRKSGEEMENRLDHTGMYVTRSADIILQANNAGVVATDVTVRNYLMVGEHARFEDYNNGVDSQRTACFFV